MAFELTADELAKQNNLSTSDAKDLAEIINLFLLDIDLARLAFHEIKLKKKKQFERRSKSARNMWNDRLNNSSLEVVTAFDQYIKLYKEYLKSIN